MGSGHEHGSRLSGRVDREGLSLLLCDSVSSREKMRVRLSAGARRTHACGRGVGGRGRGQAGRRGLRVAWLGRPQLPGSLGGQRAARLPLVSRVASWAAAVREPLQYPYDSSSSGPERTPLPGSWGAGRALRQLISHVRIGHRVSRSRFPVSNGRSVAPGLAGRGGTWSPTSCDRKSRKEGVSPRRLRPGHRAR